MADLITEYTEALRKRERSSLTRVLPTDRVAFDKQVAIVRGFAAIYASNGEQPVTVDKVGAVLTPALSGSTVTQAVAFLCDVGLVFRNDKGGFIPSKEVIEYNKACQWNEVEARKKLRPLFEKTWFYRCIVPRLELSAQSQDRCLVDLAEQSGAETEHAERLIFLLKYLELATVVVITAGQVSLASKPGTQTESEKKPDTTTNDKSKNTHVYILPLENGRQVSITAPLDVTEKEIERIKAFIGVALLMSWSPVMGKE